MTDDQIEIVRNGLARDRSPDEIAQELGISRPTLLLRLAKAGWEIETPKPRRVLKRIVHVDEEKTNR